MTTISAIIITKNETQNIRRCLASLSFADEIIVVDSGSTDDTVAIAKEYTDKVFVTDWPGFGKQKNRALSHAKGDWVLSIDADECVTDALRDEIKQTLESTTRTAFSIKVQLMFYNKPIKYAVGSDHHVRLFKRSAARFTDAEVHEKVITEGAIGKLKACMLHYSFADLTSLVAKMNKYTNLGAQEKFKKGKKPSLFRPVFSGLWTFIRLYILKGGFLDGREGLALAISFAEGAYYRYQKCAFLYKS